MNNQDIRIRLFSSSDVPGILSLLAKSFPDHWAPLIEKGLDHLQYGNTPFVAVAGSRIVGTFGMKRLPLSLNGKKVESSGICSVAVDPEFRGLGIATKLSSFAMDYCKCENIGTSILFTDKPAVYEKSGWKVCPWKQPLHVSGKGCPFPDTVKVIHKIPSGNDFDLLRHIYTNGFPDFNGKIFRSLEYWQNVVFENIGEKALWLLTENAYAMLYKKDGNWNLIELFSLSGDVSAFRKMLDYSLYLADGSINIALPEKHLLMPALEGLDSGPAYDIFGEVFMVNILDSSLSCVSNDFYIAYADKF